MINKEILCFPNNVTTLIHTGMESLDEDPDATEKVRIYDRPLRESDQTESIGIYALGWNPITESTEMLGRWAEPTLNRYTIIIQGLVVDMDEQRGIATHSLFSSMIRHTLYRDSPLNYAVHQLAVEIPLLSGPAREHVTKTGLTGQGYMNNKLDGKFIFLSTTEYWVETEFK